MHNRYPNRRWIFLTSGDAATGVNFNQVMETSPATCRYNVAPTPGTETFVKYNVIEYPQHSGNEPQISVFSGWHQNTPIEGGWVDSLSIVTSGEGYSSDGNLIASGGGGTGFAGTFTQEGGGISSVAITNSGECYTSSPEIIIDSPDGSGAAVTASLVSTQPTWQSEEMYPETAVQSGTDDTYKYDYEVTGSGAYLEWSKSTMTGGGWIDSLAIRRGGSGYSSDGTLTATGGGGNDFAGTFTSTVVGSPVQNLDIVNPGGGYSPEGTLTATGGGGSGFAGTFITYQDVSPASGSLYSVAITNGGENYYEVPTIIVTSEGGWGGTGAVVQASVLPVGVIDSVHITNSGEYYTTSPTVIIDGDGSGGEIVASANPGEPTEPTVTGTGYYPLYADNILGSGFFAASGQTTGQPDCFDLALEVEASGGSVTYLDIVSGGSAYGSSGDLTAVGGGGNGFAGTFLAAASGGWVDALYVVTGGSGYNSDGTLTAVGGGGSGFAGTFSQTSGVINSAMITDQGENYVSDPEIAIVSPSGIIGTGAAVSSSIQASGAINSVRVTDGGQGYASEPTIVIGTNGADGLVKATTDSWSASGYEFEHEEMLNILSGPDWTPTGMPM